MAFAAALIVLTVLAAGTIVWSMHREADHDARDDLGKLSLVIAEETSRSLQSVDLALSQIADRINSDGLNNPDRLREGMSALWAHDYLANLVRNLPETEYISIAGVDGQVINTSLQWPLPSISVADREQFIYLRDNDDASAFVSKPVMARITNVWTFFVARRINGPHGEFLGVVHAAIRLSTLEALYQAVALGEGSAIALIGATASCWRANPGSTTGSERSPAHRICRTWSTAAVSCCPAPWTAFRVMSPLARCPAFPWWWPRPCPRRRYWETGAGMP